MAEKKPSPSDFDLPNEPTMAQVMARLAELQAASLLVQRGQLKQTAPKSNTRGPGTSPFNPRGEKDFPMPALNCTHLMPFEQKPNMHGRDREDVELINMITPGEYTIEMNDGSTRKILLNGRTNRVTGRFDQIQWSGEMDPDSNHPTPLFTGHNKQEFPSLKVILRQMLGQRAAFRDEDNQERYGRDQSPAEAIMPMKVELKRVKEFLDLTLEQREALPDAYVQHHTASHKGPLAVSVGE